MSLKLNRRKSDQKRASASTLSISTGLPLGSSVSRLASSPRREVNLRPDNENEIIVGKIQQLEKLLEEAMSDDITAGEKLRIHNIELRGALALLTSSFPSTINELLFLLEEEKVLRENLEAELAATKSRWRIEVETFKSLVDRQSEERVTARERSSLRSGDSPRHQIEDLRKKVVELETECESLRTIIKNSQIRC